jgi:hypothetical protein
MPFGQRIHDAAFVDHKDAIEARWDKTFGDRQQEIVFIGQDMDEQVIRRDLEGCLCTPGEVATWSAGKFSKQDTWPIEVQEPEEVSAEFTLP